MKNIKVYHRHSERTLLLSFKSAYERMAQFISFFRYFAVITFILQVFALSMTSLVCFLLIRFLVWFNGFGFQSGVTVNGKFFCAFCFLVNYCEKNVKCELLSVKHSSGNYTWKILKRNSNNLKRNIKREGNNQKKKNNKNEKVIVRMIKSTAGTTTTKSRTTTLRKGTA